MSLLMDALRKAEQQKQTRSDQGKPATAEAGGLALEPIDVLPVTTSTPAPAVNEPEGLPSLPERLEDLDEQFMAHAQPARKTIAPPPSPPPPSPSPPAPPPEPVNVPAVQANKSADNERASAHNLFAAKQSSQSEETGKHTFAITVGLTTLIAAIGIGIYFWWQLQPKGGLVATQAAPTASVPPVLPTPQPAPIAAVVSPAPTISAPVTIASAAEPSHPAPEAVMAETTSPPPRRSDAMPQPAAAASQAALPQGPIRVTKARMKTDPLLEQAWEAFNQGEINLARAAWEKSLRTDPRNLDALHGLASVARQQGHPEEAAELYLRALETNPKDTLAIAALASLTGLANPQQTESRLGNLLAEQPDSPHLNFALGNLHARQQRWSEAQQSYFKAHAADSANPDYLFNLAVSLDQLHKPQLAAQYYSKALAASERQPAGFDPAQLALRLKQLQSETH